jgi:hypothetical protein
VSRCKSGCRLIVSGASSVLGKDAATVGTLSPYCSLGRNACRRSVARLAGPTRSSRSRLRTSVRPQPSGPASTGSRRDTRARERARESNEGHAAKLGGFAAEPLRPSGWSRGAASTNVSWRAARDRGRRRWPLGRRGRVETADIEARNNISVLPSIEVSVSWGWRFRFYCVRQKSIRRNNSHMRAKSSA